MFTLPSETFAALKAKAEDQGSAPGAVLRAALGRELGKKNDQDKPTGPDPAFIGALRTLLARDIVEASSWSDLERRLGSRGYNLKVAGGRLNLFGRDSGECLIDATEIGASYGALMRRFDGPLTDERAAG